MSKHDPDFFKPDMNRLDEEWVNQAPLFYEHAVQLADAKAEYERAKANRDLVYAEVYLDVKQNPQNYGVDKVTEEMVKQLVTTDSRYQKAFDKVTRAKHDMDVLQAAVDALDHRKKGLENLVHLHAMNYFASPTAPKQSRERMDEVERKNAFAPPRPRRDKK